MSWLRRLVGKNDEPSPESDHVDTNDAESTAQSRLHPGAPGQSAVPQRPGGARRLASNWSSQQAVLRMRQAWSEYPSFHTEQDRTQCINKILPDFTQSFEKQDPALLEESFGDTRTLTYVISRRLSKSVTALAQHTSAKEKAAQGVLEFLVTSGTYRRSAHSAGSLSGGYGYELLNAAAILSQYDNNAQSAAEGSLGSTMVKIVFLFLSLPSGSALPPRKNVDIEPRSASPVLINDLRREDSPLRVTSVDFTRVANIFEAISTILTNTCMFEVSVSELVKTDTLILLLRALVVDAPSRNDVARDIAVSAVQCLAGNLSRDSVNYIHRKAGIGTLIARTVQEPHISPDFLVSLWEAILMILERSCKLSPVLMDDFESSGSYANLKTTVLSLERLGEDSYTSKMVDLVGQLAFAGINDAPLTDQTDFNERVVADGRRVRNIKAVTTLHEIFSELVSLSTRGQVLDSLLMIFAENPDNYRAIQRDKVFSSFVASLDALPGELKERVLQILEYLVTVLNYTPYEELSSLCVILRAPHRVTTGLSVLRSIDKLGSFDDRLKATFAEVGLLDLLLSLIESQHHLISITAEAKSDAVFNPEYFNAIWRTLQTSVSGYSANANLFRELGGLRQLMAMLDHKATRDHVLSLVYRLIVDDEQQEYMDVGLLLETLQMPDQLIGVRIDILDTLARLMVSAPVTKESFRECGGFLAVMSSLITLETLHTHDGAYFLKALFHTTTVAVLNHPENRRYFASRIGSSILAETLRLSGLVSTENGMGILQYLLNLACEYPDVETTGFQWPPGQVHNPAPVIAILDLLPLLPSTDEKNTVLQCMCRGAMATAVNIQSMFFAGALEMMMSRLSHVLLDATHVMHKASKDMVVAVATHSFNLPGIKTFLRLLAQTPDETLHAEPATGTISTDHLVDILISVCEASHPAFVDFPPASHGEALVPSLGERAWPPASGFSIACWLWIGSDGEQAGVAAVLSRDKRTHACLFFKDKYLVLQTALTGKNIAEFKFEFERERWYHIVVTQSRYRFHSTTATLFVDGHPRDTAKLSYPITAPSGIYCILGGCAPSAASLAHVRLGPVYLVEDAMSAASVWMLWAAGFEYNGRFAGDLMPFRSPEIIRHASLLRLAALGVTDFEDQLEFMSLAGTQLSQYADKIVFHFSAECVREVYDEDDTLGRDTIRLVMINTATDNGFPLAWLQNSSECIAAKHFSTVLQQVGGAVVLLRLVELAETPESLRLALSAIRTAIHGHAASVSDMDRGQGWELLAYHLKAKASMIDTAMLDILFRMMGLEPSSPGHAVLANDRMLRHVLFEGFDIWINAPLVTRRILFRRLHDFFVGNDHRVFNMTRMRDQGLTGWCLRVLRDQAVDDELVLPTISLLHYALTDDCNRDDLQRISNFVIATLPGIAQAFRDQQSSATSCGEPWMAVTRRNALLEMLVLLTEERVEACDSSAVDNILKVLGDRLRFTALMGSHIHPTTVTISTRLLVLLLQSKPSYLNKFRTSGGFQTMETALSEYWANPDLFYTVAALMLGADPTAPTEAKTDHTAFYGLLPDESPLLAVPEALDVLLSMIAMSVRRRPNDYSKHENDTIQYYADAQRVKRFYAASEDGRSVTNVGSRSRVLGRGFEAWGAVPPSMRRRRITSDTSSNVLSPGTPNRVPRSRTGFGRLKLVLEGLQTQRTNVSELVVSPKSGGDKPSLDSVDFGFLLLPSPPAVVRESLNIIDAVREDSEPIDSAHVVAVATLRFIRELFVSSSDYAEVARKPETIDILSKIVLGQACAIEVDNAIDAAARSDSPVPLSPIPERSRFFSESAVGQRRGSSSDISVPMKARIPSLIVPEDKTGRMRAASFNAGTDDRRDTTAMAGALAISVLAGGLKPPVSDNAGWVTAISPRTAITLSQTDPDASAAVTKLLHSPFSNVAGDIIIGIVVESFSLSSMRAFLAVLESAIEGAAAAVGADMQSPVVYAYQRHLLDSLLLICERLFTSISRLQDAHSKFTANCIRLVSYCVDLLSRTDMPPVFEPERVFNLLVKFLETIGAGTDDKARGSRGLKGDPTSQAALKLLQRVSLIWLGTTDIDYERDFARDVSPYPGQEPRAPVNSHVDVIKRERQLAAMESIINNQRLVFLPWGGDAEFLSSLAHRAHRFLLDDTHVYRTAALSLFKLMILTRKEAMEHMLRYKTARGEFINLFQSGFEMLLNKDNNEFVNWLAEEENLPKVRLVFEDVMANTWRSWAVSERNTAIENARHITVRHTQRLQRRARSSMTVNDRERSLGMVTVNFIVEMQEMELRFHAKWRMEERDIRAGVESVWKKYMAEWSRERSLWGPLSDVPDQHWMLDPMEGPYRMRAKLRPHTSFYDVFPKSLLKTDDHHDVDSLDTVESTPAPMPQDDEKVLLGVTAVREAAERARRRESPTDAVEEEEEEEDEEEEEQEEQHEEEESEDDADADDGPSNLGDSTPSKGNWWASYATPNAPDAPYSVNARWRRGRSNTTRMPPPSVSIKRVVKDGEEENRGHSQTVAGWHSPVNVPSSPLATKPPTPEEIDVPEEPLPSPQDEDMDMLEDIDADSDPVQTQINRIIYPEEVLDVYATSSVAGMDKCDGILVICPHHLFVIDGYYLDPQTGQITETPPKDESKDAEFDWGTSGGVYNAALDDETKTHLIVGHPARRWAHDVIREIHKRRYLLRPVGIELFSTDGRSLLLVFDIAARNQVFNRLLSMNMPNAVFTVRQLGSKTTATPGPHGAPSATTQANYGARLALVRKGLTRQWQDGRISNFQYLMHLNTLAGRSYNDLTQYPVFPWVLADYKSDALDLSDPATFRDLSKPMGAQSERRAAMFKERYDNWEDPITPGFHYATHYSTAAIVLHYLIRLEPFTRLSIALQSGKFDHPDRLFSSIASAWESASENNMSDVRELIPEFYYLSEFLVNPSQFDFGRKQTGEEVGAVKLPPWARDSPHVFIRMHRQALESEYVSSHLHEWIDMIFGYKQRGREAEEAMNVFHYLTYEAAVDVDAIEDPVLKAATIAQINNFGQTPKQLFTKPHPRRHGVQTGLGVYSNPELLAPSIVRDTAECVSQIVLHHNVLHTGSDRRLLPPSYAKCIQYNLPDGSLSIHVNDTYRTVSVHDAIHDGCVRAVAVSENGRLIITGGDDTLVKVWAHYKFHKQRILSPIERLIGHNAPITVLALCHNYSVLVSGSDDCTCIIWDLSRLRYVCSLRGHNKPISSIAINDLSGAIVTCAESEIRIWSVNGDLLVAGSAGHMGGDAITACSFSLGPEWLDSNVVLTGHDDGTVRFWTLETPTWYKRKRDDDDDDTLKLPWELRLRHNFPPSEGSITALTLSSDQRRLYVGCDAGTITCWSIQEMTKGATDQVVLRDPSRDVQVQQGPKAHWEADEDNPMCSRCGTRFTIVERRHHCRLCGKVMCRGCTDKKIELIELGYFKPVRCPPIFCVVNMCRVCEDCFVAKRRIDAAIQMM